MDAVKDYQLTKVRKKIDLIDCLRHCKEIYTNGNFRYIKIIETGDKFGIVWEQKTKTYLLISTGSGLLGFKNKEKMVDFLMKKDYSIFSD